MRAVARRIERLQKLQLPGVTCYSVDLEKTTDVARLLNGVDTVYYLVHGMGESKDFIKHERRVAENVRDALLITPVKQLIFLSSLQNMNSPRICAPASSPPIFCAARAYR